MIAIASPVIAAAALFTFAAAPFPAIDVSRLCADAALSVDADRASASCRRQETEARTKLHDLWGRLSAAERSVCVGDAELGTARSYADIIGCIETSRELDREKALTRGARRQSRPRPRPNSRYSSSRIRISPTTLMPP